MQMWKHELTKQVQHSYEWKIWLKLKITVTQDRFFNKPAASREKNQKKTLNVDRIHVAEITKVYHKTTLNLETSMLK